MPQWNPNELRQIEALITEIASSQLPRRCTTKPDRIDLRLSQAVPLIEGLGGSTRALPVRQLLRALRLDEHRRVEWRMEHKLVQALVLRHWVPDFVPVACGLKSLTRQHGTRQVRQFLAEHFPVGYVIKRALGDSSGELANGSKETVLGSIESGERPARCSLIDESHLVQERIALITEYRVHTVEDQVIPDLTFHRYASGNIGDERHAPNAFVEAILTRLPDGLVGETLLAWDIALQRSGEFTVIEVNFSGFHPVFKRGFHCSGYFHDQEWGACDTARLLNHIQRTRGIQVTTEADAPEYPIENRFYQEVAIWQCRHRGDTAALPLRSVDPRTEDMLLRPLIHEIEALKLSRRREPVHREIELQLSNALPLFEGLAASTRALLVRQVFLALGFDERRLGYWRLEHKLVQALVFRHYCVESLPRTHGFDRLTQNVEPPELRKLLKEKFPAGFIIKTALSDSSGLDIDFRTEAALSWMESGGRYTPGPGVLTDEEFIVQERVSILREYRVHTIEDLVIEDLTLDGHRGLVEPGERRGPNAYVQRMLDALPSAIVWGSHLAWNVALLEGRSFATIEVHIGGIHTRWNAGFHASRFFYDEHYGAIYTARLLLFLEATYRCQIRIVADVPECVDEQYFYCKVADCKTRFSPVPV